MARVQKLYDRLDALEAEIRERLVPALHAAAEGKTTTFFIVGAYSPFPDWLNSSETEALLALADEARALRHQTGESVAGAIGEQLREYCRRASDTSDHNRLGPQRLAKQFLAELGEWINVS
ncbi:MAG TPA: hypothetical protein VHR66_32015 [Gemmataceae bacterium]|jgi:hypothetical protein|nr:hypothetical protein [Gemmataceae bacterium]